MWPIWLLDIDGVINASPYKIPTHVWTENEWIVEMVPDARLKEWKITAAKPVIEFIRKVHEEKWAEVVWLTTWQNDAHNVSDALGLPRLRVLKNPMLDGTRYHESAKWWKLSEATRMDVSGARPLIWTDDDLSRQVKDLFLTEHPDNHLLITPNSSEGLAPRHLMKIRSFLKMPYDGK